MPPTPAVRTVQYWKWDGALHWRHDMVLLGEDDHGIWLGAPKGAVLQRGTEPPRRAPVSFVQLIVPDVLWTAIFNAEGSKYEIYVDLTTPASWVSETQVDFIDLDLDVVRRTNGVPEIIDEDEFAEHSEAFDYPADLIASVTAAADTVLGDVTAGAEPFGAASKHWLAELASLEQ